MLTDAIVAWAGDRGLEVRRGAELPTDPDIHTNPSVDFGGRIRRVPAVVLYPRDVDELAACVGRLRESGLPWVARGAGHASGGQALIADGAVLDLRHLDRVLAEDDDTITVQAGIWWLEVFRRLASRGRRPTVLTDNLRSSVGGTLAVGGVGEASHLEGLQLDGVLALTLVTPDGAIRRVGPDDPLFRFTLGGMGQLGVIAEVTLATRPRPPWLALRAMMYPTLPAYLEAARLAAEDGRYAFFRGRMLWHRQSNENPVRAVVGAFSADPADAPPVGLFGARGATEPVVIDLVARARTRRSPWPRYCPCAEVALPLPHGLEVWSVINRAIRAFGLPSVIPDGSSVMRVAPANRLPLGLVPPDAPAAFLVALRPPIEDQATADKVAAFLRALSDRAVLGGGRIYAVGEEPDAPTWFQRQYRDVLPEWRALKRALDPDGRCHPWHLR